MKKLHELPRNSPLRVYLKDGTAVDATFHYIDGMYSYCTIGGDPEKVFHLKLWTPMVEKDGRWEIVED